MIFNTALSFFRLTYSWTSLTKSPEVISLWFQHKKHIQTESYIKPSLLSKTKLLHEKQRQNWEAETRIRWDDGVHSRALYAICKIGLKAKILSYGYSNMVSDNVLILKHIIWNLRQVTCINMIFWSIDQNKDFASAN